MSSLSRRRFLTRSLALGCSAAASPLITPVSFASAPWDARLVVLILRGGMDGIDAVRPYGDPAYAAARAPFAMGGEGEAMDLDGYFAMHPALTPLAPLWQAGQLGFVHAVSTPYRDKRSHFDGQDILEAGTAGLDGTRDGWLNRLLQVSAASDARTAFAIGRDAPRLLDGAAPVSNWSPEVDLQLSPQARELAELMMQDDPVFADALAQALVLAEADGDSVLSTGDAGDMLGQMMAEIKESRGTAAHVALADFAATQLAGDARIAAFSLNGWDTHQRQSGALTQALTRYAQTITALKDGLGPVWGKTVVLAMTEFGRTARLNGTRGTDHGTGGAMMLAGGALRGGRVLGDWPGMDEAALLDRRDLMPTRDLRAHAAWAMRGLFGLSVADLERTVFPGLEMGEDPGLLL